MNRLFVAITLPDAVRDQLVDAMDDAPTLRWTSDENLHLTLRFIGEVDTHTADELAGALGSIRTQRFMLKVSGVGRFDHRNGGAVWAAVQPREALSALAAKVERACQRVGLDPEHRTFHPHITLARYSRSARLEADDWLHRNATLSLAPFELDSMSLFESKLSRHGAHYEEIARFPLG